MVIVAAIDRSNRSQRVRQEAVSLAEAFKDEVHFVHVMSESEYAQMEEESLERTGTTVSKDGIREYAASIAEEVLEGTEVTSEAVGLAGDAASEITRYANNWDARYIVVGPRKRSPTGKAIFGSVGQSILLNAECPVVTTIQAKSGSNDE